MYINPLVLDSGLTVLQTGANRLDICTQEPTTYTEATSTYSRGNKTSPTVSAPENASPNGRKVTVSAITNGNTTGSGTVTAWALVDTVNSRLLAAGPLSAGVSVTVGNQFTLNAFDIRLPSA